MFGVAITSSSPAVASRCAYVAPGVGAACTQNVTDPRLGPRLLGLVADGAPAEVAVAKVVVSEADIAWRQLTAIGATGRPAAWSGEHALGTYASVEGENCVAAGNMLASGEVVSAMAATFDRSDPARPLAERLLAALRAGADAGGEEGPLRSAGLLVAADVPWPVTDLRVDWTYGDAPDPVGDLARLWEVWRPQEAAYRQRGLDPQASPGYGVPGDDRPA
jgi:uncharacterized Ntn-hydrolase superfamily protein